MSTTPRDRMTNPSINFPQSEQEAAQAILHAARRALFSDRFAPFTQTFTTDSGLGTTRTQQQADWLTQQQAIIGALFTDLLDSLDHSRQD